MEILSQEQSSSNSKAALNSASYEKCKISSFFLFLDRGQVLSYVLKLSEWFKKVCFSDEWVRILGKNLLVLNSSWLDLAHM